MAKRNEVTDEQMEKEIAELERSPATKLGRSIVNAKARAKAGTKARRQRLYTLRYFNRIGNEIGEEQDELF